MIESDETEIAPSRKTRPRPRSRNLKFVSLVERGGKVRSKRLTGSGPGQIGTQVRRALRDNVDEASTLHTDGAQHYKTAWPIDQRASVDHNKEFVLPEVHFGDQTWPAVHTNSAEGYFSIFKRGLVGTYRHMSEQHLNRYLAEFDFRMSNRIKLGITDDMRTDIALEGIVGKRLTYRRTSEARDA